MNAARLILLGAGGHGRVVADAAAAAGAWREVVFLDDRYPELSLAGPWRVVGRMDDVAGGEPAEYCVAIGDCRARKSRLDRLLAGGASVVSVVHPRACVSAHAAVGAGSVLLAGAVVNVGASLGRAVIVNTGATVDHDCVIADGVHIAPGANLSGNVQVGEASWIGVGACVRQGIRIGAGVMVGAGAVVVDDVPDNATVVGNPARVRA